MAENEASPAPSSKKFLSSQEWPARVLTTKNLSVVIAGGVLIVALAKADAKDIPQIVKILVESKTFWAVGWILAIIFLLLAILAVRLLIGFYRSELDRVAKERDNLQNMMLERMPPK